MQNSESELGSFLAGFVIGALVGAATALILAPQSGMDTNPSSPDIYATKSMTQNACGRLLRRKRTTE